MPDVEPDIDEKLAVKALEETVNAVSPSGVACVFTVVPNGFLALQCTENCCYDMAIVTKDMPHLAAADMMRVLRAVGSPLPVVVLLEPNDPWGDREVDREGFFGALRKPYSIAALGKVRVFRDVASFYFFFYAVFSPRR